ncbi:flagellar biosynthetic protein FliO [Aliikangiella marina]|nr:flagellar biosynthetic protein FliO [Aliikangiella marina]
MKYWCGRVLLSVFVLIAAFESNSVSAAEGAAKPLTPTESILPVIGGLLAVLVLIFVLASILKKFSSFNLVAKNINLVDSQSIGAKEKIVIVEIQNRQLVLGVTAHNINPLCELEKPIKKDNKSASFESMMKQFLNPGGESNPPIFSNVKRSESSQQLNAMGDS